MNDGSQAAGHGGGPGNALGLAVAAQDVEDDDGRERDNAGLTQQPRQTTGVGVDPKDETEQRSRKEPQDSNWQTQQKANENGALSVETDERGLRGAKGLRGERVQTHRETEEERIAKRVAEHGAENKGRLIERGTMTEKRSGGKRERQLSGKGSCVGESEKEQRP